MPCILNNGESFKVNCLSGEGVKELRQNLLIFITSMPWYKEGMPSSWIDLQAQLAEIRKKSSGASGKSSPFLSTEEYMHTAKACGVQDDMLQSATAFLHDSGVIRFFGDWQRRHDKDLLHSTIFNSPVWMMQVMKGLIRHDMQALHSFFQKQNFKSALRHVNNLTTCGLLHEQLIPFLWPACPESFQFWRCIRESERGRELWPEDIISNVGELNHAMALLEGFDLIVKVGCEYVVPSVLPPAMLNGTPELDCPECPYRSALKYSKLPSGAFDVLIVRLIKKYPAAFDFASTHASFYDSSGHVVQLFHFKNKGAHEGQTEDWLVLRSSSSGFLVSVEEEVGHVETFYPGLSRVGKTKSVQDMNESNPQAHASPPGDAITLLQYTRPSFATSIACNHCRVQNAFDRNILLDKFNQITMKGTETREPETVTNPCIACTNCHKHQLFDLVTTFQISETRQCPSCLQNGVDQPGEFIAGECRLRQSFLSSSSINSITCATCLAAGRLGKLAICDVSPAEVYISGLSLLDEHCQRAIEQWLGQLEVEAEICCCKAESMRGSDHVQLVQCDQNLQYAPVMLVLLSDTYLDSEECMEELIIASNMKKCIVPIVISFLMRTALPDNRWTEKESNSIWNAVKVACERQDADKARLEPLLIQHAKPFLLSNSDLSMTMSSPSELMRDVVSKIKMQIQRPGKVDFYADFSILGIKLSYFETFIQTNGGRGAFKKLTTLQVMEKFIIPSTKDTKLSYCEHLASQGRQGFSNSVGRAEWFYSHAWKYLFLNVIDAARLYFAKDVQDGKDPIIWFDVFSVSQHKADIRPFEWWNSAFLNAVGSIGKVLMLVQPFDDEETGTCAWVTLTRVLCVFELFACESTMSKFEVTMTRAMSDRFMDSLQRNDWLLLKSLAAIKCEDSKAFKPEDQTRVFEVINRTIGFQLLNSLVLRVMERWIYSELLNKVSVNSATNLLQTMKEFCILCKDRRETTLLVDHADSIRSRHLLACITRALDDPEYLRSLISRNCVLVNDAEEMMQTELKEKAEKFEQEAKAVRDQEASKRGQALIEAEKARKEAEEKARLEASQTSCACNCTVS